MDSGCTYLTAWTLESIGFFLNCLEISVFVAVHDFLQADVEGFDFEFGKLFHQLLLVAILEFDCSPQVNGVFRVQLKHWHIICETHGLINKLFL